MDSQESPRGAQLRKMKEKNVVLERHITRTLSEFKQANHTIIQQHSEEEKHGDDTILQNRKKLREKLTEIKDEIGGIRQELAGDEQRKSGFNEMIQHLRRSLSAETQPAPAASCSHCCVF